MSKIKMLPFSSVLKDNTSRFTKIKKQDYLKKGIYKIIDQGQGFIAGFTNDSNCVNNFEGEVIIFGDHTRVFKFINFPIAIGADGVKVLEVINKDEFDVKFLYYYLKSIKLHDAGYSRHFKFLKEIKIPLLSLQDQQKTAQKLSQIEELINKRRESIKLLDELIKSTFLDIFGDPILNNKKLTQVNINSFTDVQTGATPNRTKQSEYFDNGIYPWIRTTEVQNCIILGSEEKITKQALKDTNCKIFPINTIIIAMYGEGKTRGQVGLLHIEATTNQACAAILPNQHYSSMFLYYQLQYMYKLFRKMGRGGGRPNLNLSMIKNFKVISPKYEDIKEIKKFEKIVTQIAQTKTYYQNSLRELNNLFGSIAQKAFIGEDVKKKIEKMKTYKSVEDRLKSVEKEFIFKMDKIMGNKSDVDLTIDDERKALALTLGYKFGFYDDESIKLIDDFLDLEEFLIGDKNENELINKILEKHPQPNVFASIIKDNQSKNDEVKIIKNIVNKHYDKNILINPLINLIFEKEQNLRVRYASSELIADYDNLSEETIKEIIKIIYDEGKIEEEVRLHTAYAFTDKINLSLELYKAIYWILIKQSTSLLSNKEVFIHFLKKEFEEKKESLAFDTLVKNIAYDSRKMTAYKMFLFDLLKYDIDIEILNNYDYKALKDDIFRLIKEKKIIQKLNSSTYEINLFWNFSKLEEK